MTKMTALLLGTVKAGAVWVQLAMVLVKMGSVVPILDIVALVMRTVSMDKCLPLRTNSTVPPAFVVMGFQAMEHVIILPSAVLKRVHVSTHTGPVVAGPTTRLVAGHAEGETLETASVKQIGNVAPSGVGVEPPQSTVHPGAKTTRVRGLCFM